jgi:cobalt-zinc-cadmium efflux system protein
MAEHHDHDHGHDHQHGAGGHQHVPANFGKAFAIGIALNLAYVVGEAFYGIVAHSLALLADAGHNLGDVLGLAGAWLASILGKLRPSGRYTYGLRRSSILAALGNAIVLLLVTGGIAWEGIRRLMDPRRPYHRGGGGDRHPGQRRDGLLVHVRPQGRLEHQGRVPALGGGRPCCTWRGDRGRDHHGDRLAMAGSGDQPRRQRRHRRRYLVAAAGFGNFSLDAVPPGVDQDRVEAFLRKLPGVAEVHDLHIWGMSTTETALTAHLVRPGASIDDDLLHNACKGLKEHFGITHATLQVEDGTGAHACSLRSAEVV